MVAGMRISGGLQGSTSEALRWALVGAPLDPWLSAHLLHELAIMAMAVFSEEVCYWTWDPVLFYLSSCFYSPFLPVDILDSISLRAPSFSVFILIPWRFKRASLGHWHNFLDYSMAWVSVLPSDVFPCILCVGKKLAFSFDFVFCLIIPLSTSNPEARTAVLGRTGTSKSSGVRDFPAGDPCPSQRTQLVGACAHCSAFILGTDDLDWHSVVSGAWRSSSISAPMECASSFTGGSLSAAALALPVAAMAGLGLGRQRVALVDKWFVDGAIVAASAVPNDACRSYSPRVP